MLRKLALVMAISPAMWLTTATALGLGEIDVQSKLNQRLTASIPLTDLAPDELDNLTVGLAQGDAFDKAGLARSDYLNALTFTIKGDDGDPRILITSKQIAREPSLNILLDVRGRNGRIQRAFTVLLDPPDYVLTKSTPADDAIAPPVTLSQKAQKKSPEKDTELRLDKTRTETGTYGPIKSGETLWSVAERLRADPYITMDQMQLALYKANPEAFENGRFGSLLKGAMLKVPTERTIKSVSASKAKARVRQLRTGPRPQQEYQHRPDFSSLDAPRTLGQHKAKPVAAPASEAPAPAAAEKPAATPKPATTPVTPPPSSVPSPAAAKPAPVIASAVVAPPPVVTTPVAASAVAVASSSAVTTTLPASSVVGAIPAAESASATNTASPEGSASSVHAAASSSVEAQPAEQVKPYIPPPQPTGPEPTPLMEELEGPIKIAGGVAVLAGLLGWILLSRKKNPKPAPALPKIKKPINWQFWKSTGSADQEQKSAVAKPGKKFSEAVAASAGAFNQQDFAHDVESTQKSPSTRFSSETQKLDQTLSHTLSDTAQLPNFDSTKNFDGPPDVGLGDINTDAVDFDVTGKFEAETLKIDLNSNDPVAEADFHLAYGLYDEAALQLKQAAQKQPDRTDIRTKLAEVYFRSGKAAEFQEVAQSLKPMLSQAEWTKVAVMGKQISPDSPLFQGVDTNVLTSDIDMAFDEPAAPSAPVPAPVAAKASAAPGTMDFELDNLDFDLPKTNEFASAASTPVADASNTLEFKLEDFAPDTPTLKSSPVETTLLSSSSKPVSMASKPATPAPVTSVDAPLEFDLSAFDLGTPEHEAAETKLPNVDEIKLDDFDLSMPDDSNAISTGDEASTKLDLARAYVDMGDNDMARSLLKEVLEQGSVGQKSEAQSLLSRLA